MKAAWLWHKMISAGVMLAISLACSAQESGDKGGTRTNETASTGIESKRIGSQQYDMPMGEERSSKIKGAQSEQGYSAKKEGLRSFFESLSSRLNKSIIVSQKAAAKQVTGEFDLRNPQTFLERLTAQLGLIWYYDGQAIYIYDSSEIKNAVISLRYISLEKLNTFLRKSGLYDRRYPLRGEGGTFYVSGPPVYVDLLINAAKMIDKAKQQVAEVDAENAEQQKTVVIRLQNTFVGDRTYALRDQKITIPGIATVLGQLLNHSKKTVEIGQVNTPTTGAEAPAIPPLPEFPENSSIFSKAETTPFKTPPTLPEALKRRTTVSPSEDMMTILSYPNTNSLVVKGTEKQIRSLQDLVSMLDIEKKHVELSLWIIDLQKDDLDQLGVQWSGGIGIGNKFGATFNSGSSSTLDGGRFLASVSALSNQNKAQVVSRPIVLTQENVPALFDNTRTFYAKLVGERNSQLDHVTYGTLVSVLPRFAGDGQIDMVLDIEDGAEVTDNSGATETTDTLPQISRTHINTVARVPKGKSLLIGGYISDQKKNGISKIPLLGDLPWIGNIFRYRQKSTSNLVRVFLIQPKQIDDPLQPDANVLSNEVMAHELMQKEGESMENRLNDYLNRVRMQTP